MCWLYAPGSEASNLDFTSLVPEVVSSVTWRGKLQALASWRRVWKTATYLRRLSGLTSSPSTLVPGVGSWIASLQASRVNPGPLLASGSASRTTDGSGGGLHGSFAIWDPASSSWRMSQGFLFPGLDTFSGPWPRWGSLQSGGCSARPAWAPPTSASEYSSWPTATVEGNNNRVGLSEKSGDGLGTAAKAWGTPTNSRPLNEVATRWHTPRAAAAKMGSPRDNDRDDLQAQARDWPTPRAGNPSSRQSESYCRGNPTLLGAARDCWPTPDASVSEGYNQSPSPGAAIRPALAALAKNWGTPRTAAHSPASFLEGRMDPRIASPSLIANDLLGRYWRVIEEPFEAILGDGLIIGRPVRLANGETLTQHSGQLNPEFVRWLMGFPAAWTNCGPSETEWSRWLQQSRSELFRLVPDST